MPVSVDTRWVFTECIRVSLMTMVRYWPLKSCNSESTCVQSFLTVRAARAMGLMVSATAVAVATPATTNVTT